jgi:hypothetical protein
VAATSRDTASHDSGIVLLALALCSRMRHGRNCIPRGVATGLTDTDGSAFVFAVA